MKLLSKYIILYFDTNFDNKNMLLRRILENNEVKWQFFDKKKWADCDESFREELKPSILEAKCKSHMRSLKLERILLD